MTTKRRFTTAMMYGCCAAVVYHKGSIQDIGDLSTFRARLSFLFVEQGDTTHNQEILDGFCDLRYDFPDGTTLYVLSSSKIGKYYEDLAKEEHKKLQERDGRALFEFKEDDKILPASMARSFYLDYVHAGRKKNFPRFRLSPNPNTLPDTPPDALVTLQAWDGYYDRWYNHSRATVGSILRFE